MSKHGGFLILQYREPKSDQSGIAAKPAESVSMCMECAGALSPGCQTGPIGDQCFGAVEERAVAVCNDAHIDVTTKNVYHVKHSPKSLEDSGRAGDTWGFAFRALGLGFVWGTLISRMDSLR